jgi:hypothetical protein
MTALELQHFHRGWFTVEAVQLTEDNLWQVFEWSDSKPFYGPKTDDNQPHPITGLTVFEPTGRNKAEFGDWVYRTPGGDFKTKPDAEFRRDFQPAEEATR